MQYLYQFQIIYYNSFIAVCILRFKKNRDTTLMVTYLLNLNGNSFTG